jgi:DNA-binding NtrC family response regulator
MLLFSGKFGKEFSGMTAQAEQELLNRDWKGNVRELRNVIEQSVIMARTERIAASDLVLTRWAHAPGADTTERAAAPGHAEPAPIATLAESERRVLLDALNANRWNVSKAARQLGVSRDTLRYRIQKFGLTFP